MRHGGAGFGPTACIVTRLRESANCVLHAVNDDVDNDNDDVTSEYKQTVSLLGAEIGSGPFQWIYRTIV